MNDFMKFSPSYVLFLEVNFYFQYLNKIFHSNDVEIVQVNKKLRKPKLSSNRFVLLLIRCHIKITRNFTLIAVKRINYSLFQDRGFCNGQILWVVYLFKLYCTNWLFQLYFIFFRILQTRENVSNRSVSILFEQNEFTNCPHVLHFLVAPLLLSFKSQ